MVKPANYIRPIFLPNYKGHVDGRSALRDNLHVCRPHGVEHPAGQPGSLPQSDADNGHDGAMLLDPYLPELAEVADEGFDPGAILDRQRNTHLTACQYVDHGFVALEHFEQRPEEAI